MNPIEHLDERPHLHRQARFFLQFTPDGRVQRLTEFDHAAGNGPLTFARFVTAPDEQGALPAYDDAANADDGCRGILSGHMKSHTEYLTFNLPARLAFENITPHVEAAVRASGVQEGLVLVNAMHITASVFINDDESGLHRD